MRLAILALALLAFPVTAATADVPNMTCKAEGTWQGRVANGKHSITDGADERTLRVGHMLFVLDNLRGVVYLDCKS